MRAAIAACQASLGLDQSAATHASLAFLFCEAGSFAQAADHARRAMETDGSPRPGRIIADQAVLRIQNGDGGE